MTLHPQPIPPVPDATAAAAEAAFPKGNVYMDLRAELGTLYSDLTFLPLFQPKGRSVEVAPWRLALILVLQYFEGLSDRQAADAVRRCIDWKYILSLELTDPGFDFSLLSDFRERILIGGLEQHFLDILLTSFKQRGLLKPRGRQRTDSTHVLANIRTLNRLECVGETLRAALNQLASVVPAWLQEQVTSDWFDRYGARIENYRLPTAESDRLELAQQIGADGFQLLQAIAHPDAPTWLWQLPAVAVLRQVWIQQYYAPCSPNAPIQWRAIDDLPPGAQLIHSPYDSEARWCQKRQTTWVGYKAHITETCDDTGLNLITHITTTPATTSDDAMVEPIHQVLAAKDLLPSEHLLDGGYVDADQLVISRQQYDVEVLGPVRPDQSWQARAGQGFDTASFGIDWENHIVTCPRGQRSVQWKEGKDVTGQGVVRVRFKKADCLTCPARSACTRSKVEPRELTFRPREQWIALRSARERQLTAAFRADYALRSGSESTISQATRGFELRRTRYRGLSKTRLQHILTAVAINLARFAAWLHDRLSSAPRVTPFAALAASVGPPI